MSLSPRAQQPLAVVGQLEEHRGSCREGRVWPCSRSAQRKIISRGFSAVLEPGGATPAPHIGKGRCGRRQQQPGAAGVRQSEVCPQDFSACRHSICAGQDRPHT